MGAVVLEGPKACGKTETARQVAASEVRLDVDQNARNAVSIDPSLILEGATPRLIDECQIAPVLWNHVRRAVDDQKMTGQFVLTGSAVPRDDETRHTGAARIARLRMRPMSLYESGHSEGGVSVSSLLQGIPPRAPDPGVTIEMLVERIAVGGWPAFIDQPVARALTVTGILRHLGLPPTAPPLTPARSPARDELALGADPLLDLDQTPAFDPTEPDPIPDFDFDQSWGA